MDSKIIVDSDNTSVVYLSDENASSQSIFDRSTLSKGPSGLIITKIQYACFGGNISILWEDAGSGQLIYVVPDGQSGEINFEEVGGLHSRDYQNATGNIIIQRSGGVTTPTFSVYLHLAKVFE